MKRVIEFFKQHKKLAFFPALLVGVLFFIIMVKTKPAPKMGDASEHVTIARVITVPEVAVVPRAVGYGTVQPGHVWQAVAEVSGRIVEIDPELKQGNILAKDTVLLRIDPAEAGFIRGQSEADVEAVLADIRTLDQEEKDLKRQLGVEQNKLALIAKDAGRQQTLADQGVISTSELDKQQQSVLTQRNVVQNLQSSLNGIPSRRQALSAKLASARHKLSDAELDEVRTIILAPFDCRVSAVNVEEGQAVKVGEMLAQVDSIGASEAIAQVPLYAFREIVPQNMTSPFAEGSYDKERMLAFMGISAVVRVDISGGKVEWEGRLSRLGDAVDAQTRTLSVYVVVDDPYIKAQAGKRPPLIKNMYAEVELRGKPRSPMAVVPRGAVHGGVVYVMDAENRLRMREVTVDLEQAGFTGIAAGLEPGETIVVSDLVPAIEGMLIEPMLDESLLESVIAEAKGQGSVR